MKFCFIYNKKASSGRKSNFIKKICNNLKLSHHVDLYETVTEKEAEDLFKQIVKQDYDRLVVAGGDGSVCFAINQLIKNNFQPKENFAIGYVPAGTANILQAELGMSKNIKKICNNLKLSHHVDLFETVTEKEAEDLFKQIVKQDYDRLVVAGGDGSVCFAINQLIKNNFQPKENFAIGYVPAGTANILQAELGISKNINKISQTLMSDNLEKTNLVKINDNYFILMAGIGWDAQIVQSINSKIKKILGKVIFGIKGLEKFIFMKNTKIKVNIDNDELLADWVLCSNSRYYAGHHKITDTNIFEEKFTTYIFKDLSRMKLLYYIFLIIFNGNLNKSTSVITKNTNEVKLKTFDKSIPIQIDGDNFGSLKNIVIKSSKRKFNLLKAA